MNWLQTVVDFAQRWVIDIGIPYGDEVIPLMVILLLGTGFYLTVRTGFVQLSRLGHGFGVTSGKYDDPDDPGAINPFEALSAALSAPGGLGNIGGVALAIGIGGPGALFWMWVVGVLGMALKSVEMEQAGASAYWLEARFLFLSVEAYDVWRTSDATGRMLAVLGETQPLQTRLVVGDAALLSRDQSRG